MCISNELCSEIAVALLVKKEESASDLTRLKEIVMEVHATLQEMREIERAIEGPSRSQKENYQ